MYNTMQVNLKPIEMQATVLEVPFTKAPTVFVPEGVFKGLENVKSYFDMEVRDYESESVNW